jgi:hypothetical protein
MHLGERLRRLERRLAADLSPETRPLSLLMLPGPRRWPEEAAKVGETIAAGSGALATWGEGVRPGVWADGLVEALREGRAQAAEVADLEQLRALLGDYAGFVDIGPTAEWREARLGGWDCPFCIVWPERAD